MNKGNREKKKIILILLSFILLVGAALFLVKSHTIQRIYGKLYTGDHIELDLSIYYKGELLTSDCIDITCINPQGKHESIGKDAETSKYSVKGGEYGKYIFTVTIEDKTEEPVVLELKFLNTNDWYISDNNCIIEIQNIDGILNCNCKINTEYNDGTLSDYSNEKQIENGKVEFSWGI